MEKRGKGKFHQQRATQNKAAKTNARKQQAAQPKKSPAPTAPLSPVASVPPLPPTKLMPTKSLSSQQTKPLAATVSPPTTPQPASKVARNKKVTVDEMTSRDFQLDTNAHLDVTAQLLKDQNCIRNFQLAIGLNKHLFRNKTVLDIGCGTGILSLFAAKAGAARVFAVDPSSVVDYTRKIVAANKYESVIDVIQGRIEDICLPVEKVDIIVCDWMGYSLLYQSTCEAVIYARDKWLRREPRGLIFPDIAKLYISGFVDPEHKNEKIEWWKNVYGFNMKCLREFALKEPSYYALHPQQIITTDFNVMTLNLYTATRKDLRFRCLYTLRVWRSGLMDGVVTYFQVRFSKSHTPIILNTDPWAPQTHWMHTVFFFDQAVPVKADEIICGGFEMVPADSDEPNLNNIEVALELCSSEPVQLQVDMHWQMKPHAAYVNTGKATGPLASPPPPPPPPSLPSVTAYTSAATKMSDSSADSQSSPMLAALLKKKGNKNSGAMKEHMRKKK